MSSSATSVERPSQPLKAFVKVTLEPGETQTVSLRLPMRAFAFYDEARAAWVAEAGRFELRVGTSSTRILQRATVWLTGDRVLPVAT